MAVIHNSRPATGGPGIAPRWTRGAKDGVGTAYSVAASVWFTMSAGILNEIYYPTIDRPQVRDLQFLVTDGKTFFRDERSMLTDLDYIDPHSLGLRIVNTDQEQGYKIVKEVITDPHLPCVLINTRLEGPAEVLSRLRLFVLLAPHLEVTGAGNNANAVESSGREILTAHKNRTWLALDATSGFLRRSCGYVGATDGWRDLADDFKMDYEFDSAPDGNVALTGEIDLSRGFEFTLGLAFGDSLHRALTTLFQSLGVPYADARERFIEQWTRACTHMLPLGGGSCDGGRLYHASHNLLLAHEDKSYPGALIASLSIPWGEMKGDEDLGGYHLVWTRDMVNSATGLMASGNNDLARRALIYLACSQMPDGGFYQNFWIDGQPYWRGIQLDEVAFPIVLAWRLLDAGALEDFDPLPMVLRAAKFLILHGPATPQERWEENSGYSPSTLAIVITALVCAADLVRRRGIETLGTLLLEGADFLESHLEDWTVTTQGTLVAGIKRHFIRILPIDVNDPQAPEDPNNAIITIKNQPPGARYEFPAKEVVDAGFLELVRYGIRAPGDPLIEDSLRVVDACLKADLPAGPCWRRYNHDGYGQREDGSSWQGSGVGRPWPLLTGERAHYELAAGRDPHPYIRAIEGFASKTGLLPEQVWDRPDNPEAMMYLGKPTGAAMPLMWAHAEYIKLLRSIRDGMVFDLVPEVVQHFRRRRPIPPEIWKFARQIKTVPPGGTLRIVSDKPFMLHWSYDGWRAPRDTQASSTVIGLHYVEIPVPMEQRAPLKFTFYWSDEQRWEGSDFEVAIKDRAP